MNHSNKIISLLILMLSLSFVSCDNDDDDEPQSGHALTADIYSSGGELLMPINEKTNASYDEQDKSLYADCGCPVTNYQITINNIDTNSSGLSPSLSIQIRHEVGDDYQYEDFVTSSQSFTVLNQDSEYLSGEFSFEAASTSTALSLSVKNGSFKIKL